MSDGQERDAAVTPEMRAEIQEIILTVRRGMDRAITAHGRTLTAMQEMHMGAFDQALFVDTAIGEIDRLTAERDAARAEVERLRAACGGAADGIERTATHGVENETKREWLRKKAKKIRAALESEGVR